MRDQYFVHRALGKVGSRVAVHHRASFYPLAIFMGVSDLALFRAMDYARALNTLPPAWTLGPMPIHSAALSAALGSDR